MEDELRLVVRAGMVDELPVVVGVKLWTHLVVHDHHLSLWWESWSRSWMSFSVEGVVPGLYDDVFVSSAACDGDGGAGGWGVGGG